MRLLGLEPHSDVCHYFFGCILVAHGGVSHFCVSLLGRQLFVYLSVESVPLISPVRGVLKLHNLAREMISLFQPGQKTGFRPPERLFPLLSVCLFVSVVEIPEPAGLPISYIRSAVALVWLDDRVCTKTCMKTPVFISF
jgi:hypothetical protein